MHKFFAFKFVKHALTPAAMAARFPEHPGAVAEAGRLADRLRFDLRADLGYRYPGAEDDTANRAARGFGRAGGWVTRHPTRR